MKPIALIDDDKDIRDLLGQFLAKQGFQVQGFDSGEDFLAQTPANFCLAILDIGLPGIDGLSVCRQLRQDSNLPVIMLTAVSDDLDRIIGLELGADDYLGKPFNPRELVARVKALLRRIDSPSVNQTSAIQVKINNAQRSVMLGNESLTLTGAEFDLLVLLAQYQGEVISKDQISQSLYGRKSGPFDRSIDTTISRLRNKLNRYVGNSIQNVRGKGYVLVIPCQ